MFFCILYFFAAHEKNNLRWPQLGPGGFFPANPDLADNLGRTDLDVDNFNVFVFWDPKFLDFQVNGSGQLLGKYSGGLNNHRGHLISIELLGLWVLP